MGEGERHVGAPVAPGGRRGYPPQGVQETLHAVGRLLFQHLDAPLHLQTREEPVTSPIPQRSGDLGVFAQKSGLTSILEVLAKAPTGCTWS